MMYFLRTYTWYSQYVYEKWERNLMKENEGGGNMNKNEWKQNDLEQSGNILKLRFQYNMKREKGWEFGRWKEVPFCENNHHNIIWLHSQALRCNNVIYSSWNKDLFSVSVNEKFKTNKQNSRFMLLFYCILQIGVHY